MNYLTEHMMHIGDGYMADINGGLRLFIQMEADGQYVSIRDRKKRQWKVQDVRPEFSFGIDPNLAVFQRFALERAYLELGRTAPTDDELLAVEWLKYGTK